MLRFILLPVNNKMRDGATLHNRDREAWKGRRPKSVSGREISG